jgi:hypothetical protein
MSRDSWSGGPMQVGAYKNFPWWRAPQTWRQLAWSHFWAFAAGVVVCAGLMQRNHVDFSEHKPTPSISQSTSAEDCAHEVKSDKVTLECK